MAQFHPLFLGSNHSKEFPGYGLKRPELVAGEKVLIG
jgi:hypothetical protein